MNLTAVGTALPSTWRRVRWQYVSLVGGLIVAGALLIANQRLPGPPEAGRSDHSRPVAATGIPKFSASDPMSLVYIVASEQQAAELTDLIAAELAAAETNYEVIIAESDEEARSIQEARRLLVQVEDSRPYLTSKSRTNSSRPKPESVEQLIIEGAASGEAALFGIADPVR